MSEEEDEGTTHKKREPSRKRRGMDEGADEPQMEDEVTTHKRGATLKKSKGMDDERDEEEVVTKKKRTKRSKGIHDRGEVPEGGDRVTTHKRRAISKKSRVMGDKQKGKAKQASLNEESLRPKEKPSAHHDVDGNSSVDNIRSDGSNLQSDSDGGLLDWESSKDVCATSSEGERVRFILLVTLTAAAFYTEYSDMRICTPPPSSGE